MRTLLQLGHGFLVEAELSTLRLKSALSSKWRTSESNWLIRLNLNRLALSKAEV